MGKLTPQRIQSASDDELIDLLGAELERRIPVEKDSPLFLSCLQELPVGLRAMAATHALDVSLTLDDLGWHFGNWHSAELAQETANGLEELCATELAILFREAFRHAQEYWEELGAADWTEWYPDSPLHEEIRPLNHQAWAIHGRLENGIFDYWVQYARAHPAAILETN